MPVNSSVSPGDVRSVPLVSNRARSSDFADHVDTAAAGNGQPSGFGLQLLGHDDAVLDLQARVEKLQRRLSLASSRPTFDVRPLCCVEQGAQVQTQASTFVQREADFSGQALQNVPGLMAAAGQIEGYVGAPLQRIAMQQARQAAPGIDILELAAQRIARNGASHVGADLPAERAAFHLELGNVGSQLPVLYSDGRSSPSRLQIWQRDLGGRHTQVGVEAR